MNQNNVMREIIEVVEISGFVYFLLIKGFEDDLGSAVGHVYFNKGQREEGEVPTQVLATNDTLRTMWLSPSGALWVASEDGSVGTTARVSWPAPTSGAEYLTMGPSPKWAVTDLPSIKATGLPPIVTALWGTGDSNVYAGTYGGHIFHWNGSYWSQVFDGPDEGKETTSTFGGAPNDVYAIGAQATILHFNGRLWQRLRVPDPPNGLEVFTGILHKDNGEVLISGSGDFGRLLHGSSAGLTELGRYPIKLFGMAALGNRVLFSTGNGVAELIDRKVQMIKSSFQTAGVSAGNGRLFFFEPAQEEPNYIEYMPSHADAPWWRTTVYF